ncbi:phenylalanine racemase [Chryseobacterium joostei]|uniref:Amino acid adenylation domain-containing protein n=1 Tax=Chryseobacterium joostei TaxID=112234 RepID=A0A1N7I3R4_9FLAO|nr:MULTISPECIES: amino acid adenylation domain-containing protein [Chryseobacterium]AZA99828.1 phenylalanine racemase [Chryseobacterium joostei]SIS31709.1 amino acid adenylation domain-containing protein [Chryseobacterium joostei]HCM33529.1 phenylalanine racemase [Chryseobacterium sp.]
MKRNLIEYLAETVKLKANNVAVIENEQEITFKKLYNNIAVLGNYILEQSDIINKPVAIYLPKSINCVIADLGVMISGNAYLNLDVKSPQQRIVNILELVKPEFIITTRNLLKNIDPIFDSEKIILIDELNFDIEGNDHVLLDRLQKRSIDTDMSCVINTSGSTGTPKSVALNHRSFVDFIEVSDEIFNFSDNEVIGSLSPVIFDIFSYELCMLISKGSCIVVLPENLAAFPIKILEEMQRTKVSFIFWVPTIMVNIANMDLLTKVNLDSLKLVWFAGEVFPTKQFNYWKKNLTHTKFANLYGPIEITLDCTYFIVDRDFEDNEPLPIGIPYRNTDVLIITDEDKLAEKGEEGELCVRGSSLALGYYNNPEKTQAAFVQNPLNSHYPEVIYRTGDIVALNDRNEIIFKGRKDTLIKHQGYRIELGEIEHIIVNTLKIAKNACCVYNRMSKEIVLYYENATDIEAAVFRKELLASLPKYMIPTVYIRYDEMPRNPNGKIDRAYLNQKANS